MNLDALKAKAGQLAPMASDSVPILQGRILYVDGDGLAYYCAGNDDTLVSQARERVREKVSGMQRAAAAESVVILLTGSGSHKGHRYAIARAKPYQGQRANSRRPKNWRALRELLEQGAFGKTILDYDREADDRFGQFGWADPEHTVIATQDKDMRMVPGYHLDWADNRMFFLPRDTYSAVFNDKQYGEKWFWLQMLHGDTADFIPGLPRAYGKLCGPVAAEKILAGTYTSEQAAAAVAHAYRSYYNDFWLDELAEQACLLWMRAGENAHWFEACSLKGPLRHFHKTHREELYGVWRNLNDRVRQAQEINGLATQNDGGG